MGASLVVLVQLYLLQAMEMIVAHGQTGKMLSGDGYKSLV